MCEHSFDVLRVRERSSDYVFYCRHCLRIERRYVPVREPGGLEPVQLLPSDADVAAAEARDNEAAACRERWQADVAQFREHVLHNADAVAAAIEGWLKCPPAAMPYQAAGLGEMVALADAVLSCCPQAQLVAEQDLEILCAARSAAMSRLQPSAAVARARDETAVLIRSAELMLSGPVQPTTLRELVAVLDAVLAAAQSAGDRESISQLADLRHAIVARLTAAQ